MKCSLLRVAAAAILTAAVCFGACARTYLVSVGVADYSAFPQKISSLSLTTGDARAVADLYARNTSVDYSLLLDDKATKDRILRAIKKVHNKASADDIVVFFFSGHGYPGGFCAYDGNLSYDEVRQAMAESKSRNKMMFVDACRAGGMRVDEAAAGSAAAEARKANVMLFLSSRNDENSQERPAMKNGLYTTYLLRALRGNADTDRNRVITARELFDFVHDGVSRLSGGAQHPVMWGNFDDTMTVMKW